MPMVPVVPQFKTYLKFKFFALVFFLFLAGFGLRVGSLILDRLWFFRNIFWRVPNADFTSKEPKEKGLQMVFTYKVIN